MMMIKKRGGTGTYIKKNPHKRKTCASILYIPIGVCFYRTNKAHQLDNKKFCPQKLLTSRQTSLALSSFSSSDKN